MVSLSSSLRQCLPKDPTILFAKIHLCSLEDQSDSSTPPPPPKSNLSPWSPPSFWSESPTSSQSLLVAVDLSSTNGNAVVELKQIQLIWWGLWARITHFIFCEFFLPHLPLLSLPPLPHLSLNPLAKANSHLAVTGMSVTLPLSFPPLHPGECHSSHYLLLATPFGKWNVTLDFSCDSDVPGLRWRTCGRREWSPLSCGNLRRTFSVTVHRVPHGKTRGLWHLVTRQWPQVKRPHTNA